ncbi:hypothetical protein B0H19DRAFT_1186585 [Mycena capillaripes]|nr:hypothetical protein B0H19DRAFT_1186585 [Mycena capillaripes]
MWLQLLPIALLFSDCVYAQGADTIALSDITSDPSFNQVEFNFALNGNSGHQLHNVSFELISAAPEGTQVERGPMHGVPHPSKIMARFSTYSASTILTRATYSTNCTRGSTKDPFVCAQTPDPCGNVSLAVVHSSADPAYTPWRITRPAGFNVFAQNDLVEPNAAIQLELYQVDQLSDSLADMTATMEMVNNATGASVGAQTFNQDFFRTTNLTLDEGAWKLRANFTSTSARNAGTFTVYSEEVYIKGANPPQCLALAKVTQALNLTNAVAGMAVGRPAALPFGSWGLVCVVLFPMVTMFGF